jgi:hypothetical protein
MECYRGYGLKPPSSKSQEFKRDDPYNANHLTATATAPVGVELNVACSEFGSLYLRKTS